MMTRSWLWRSRTSKARLFRFLIVGLGMTFLFLSSHTGTHRVHHPRVRYTVKTKDHGGHDGLGGFDHAPVDGNTGMHDSEAITDKVPHDGEETNDDLKELDEAEKLRNKRLAVKLREIDNRKDKNKDPPNESSLPLPVSKTSHVEVSVNKNLSVIENEQYLKCITADHQSNFASMLFKTPKYMDDLKHSVEFAVASGREGCVGEIIDTYCKAEAKLLYDYKSMRPNSSCDMMTVKKNPSAGASSLKKLAELAARADKKRHLLAAVTDTTVDAVGDDGYYDEYGQSDGILFLMAVYSRHFLQQIKRIVKLLLKPEHTILFHIDRSPSSDYLVRELEAFSDLYDNVHVLPTRYDTTWGGSGLMHMYLATIEYALQFKWEHFINLSEQDFPLVSVDVLEGFLNRHKGKSFMNAKLHKTMAERKRLIAKQGMAYVCRQCQRFMFRIASREVPKNINFMVGSDWYMLSREFCEYVTNDKSSYLTAMKDFFSETILSAESFLATMAANGPTCHQVEWNNHRFENWVTGRGCQCAKTAVDWCGCSPITLRKEDVKVLIHHSTRFQRHFGRKFDPRVDMEVLRIVEGHSQNITFSRTKDWSKYVYWSNIYHWQDAVAGQSEPPYLVMYDFWTNMILADLEMSDSECVLTPNLERNAKLGEVSDDTMPTGGVQHVHTIYNDNPETSISNSNGQIVRFRTETSEGTPFLFEAYIKESKHRSSVMEQRLDAKPMIPRLVDIDLAAKYDVKNDFFWTDGPSFPLQIKKMWVVHDWNHDKLRKHFNFSRRHLRFIGCFKNEGSQRWMKSGTPGRTLNECAETAVINGHKHFMLEYSEGFRGVESECSTFNKAPSESLKTNNNECKTKSGALLGRYYRGAVYKLNYSAIPKDVLNGKAGPIQVAVSLVNPKGDESRSLATFGVKTADDHTKTEIPINPDAMPGVWKVRTKVRWHSRLGASLDWLQLSQSEKFEIDMPFFIPPKSAEDPIWQESLPFWSIVGVCVDEKHAQTLGTTCPTTKVQSCSHTPWSTLRKGFNLTLT